MAYPYVNQYSAYTNPYQYQPMIQQPMQTAQPMQQTVQQTATQTAQPVQQNVQQGGFVRVQNEQEARQYPLAPGYSMTFIDDSGNYCYVKTMGFSQLDKPKFEKYRLVREEDEQSAFGAEEVKSMDEKYALKYVVDDLVQQVEELKKAISAKVKKPKKDESEDDAK